MPSTTPRQVGTPTVLALPAFDDNYLWLIHDGVYAAVVDPGDARPVSAALAALDLTLRAILLTHHHADHIGGVSALRVHAPVPVFGPRAEQIAGVTCPVSEGDRIAVPGTDIELDVLDVPGHTRGHIAYLRRHHTPALAWLFCGDTLFAGGCGRLFEGSPAQMACSLDKLAALPDATAVYCAHEYTLDNLRFACEVEPDNAALLERVQRDSATRTRGEPTVPSTIGLEKATNPFLRCREAGLVARLCRTGKVAPHASAVDVFTALRSWKNHF